MSESVKGPLPIDTELPVAAWMCEELEMPREWLDHMGHVNIQFYFEMAARAVFHVRDRRLRPGREDDPHRTVYSLETEMRYRAELLAGQRVRIWFRPLSRTEKVVKALIVIERLAGKDAEANGPPPAISAECEWTGCYADETSRRIAPLPGEAKRAWDAKLQEAAGARPYEPPRFPKGAELTPPPEPMVSYEDIVPAEWIDRHDHVGIAHYTRIVFHANMGYMRGLGFDLRAMVERKWGAFALSTSVKYLAEMREGQRFRVLTRTTRIARKTFTLRHDIVDPEDPARRFAESEHVMAFADMSVRRTREIPEEFLARIDKAGKERIQ